MGTNRDIKSDGSINIDSTQTNITGDLDVTGSINNFNFPASDGLNGQALTTNGSGTLSFSDVAGGGAGGINYIENTRATTDTTGYATYADAAATTPVDGTGGSATTTFTRNTTTPLRDGGDFKIAKDAANRQGEGVGYAFTIDNADKARKMLISFDYDASDSDYADDDIKIFVYDVTNTNLIRVNGEDLKGGKGKHYAQFQTAADSTSYRLIFHVSSTNASAYDVFLDEISVGPVGVTSSSVSDDIICSLNLSSSVSLSPGSGVYTQLNYDSVGIDTTGSYNSSTYKYKIPESGYYDLDLGVYFASVSPADTNFAAQVTDGSTVYLGKFLNAHNTDGVLSASRTVYITKDTEIFVQVKSSDSGGFTVQNAAQTNYFTIAKRNSLSLPDSISSGADVKANAKLVTAHTISALSSSQTNIIFDEEEIDSSASYDNTTGIFTVPESGRYLITAQVRNTALADWNEGDFMKIGIEKNGSGSFYENLVEVQEVPSQTVVLAPNLAVADDFVKGDTLNVYIDAKYGGSGTLQANGGYLSITKLASAQTHIDNETVACKAFVNADYTRSDDQNHTVQFNEVAYDTHAAFDTSTYEYTFPVSGYYLVHANVVLSDFTGFANTRITDGNSSHSYVYFGANDDDTAAVTLTYMNYYSKGDHTKIYMDPTGVTEDASYTVQGNATMGGTFVSHISITRLK